MNSREIEAAKPGDTLWDDQIRGLHVRCFPTRKVFYLKYSFQRRQRRPKLGDLGILTLAAARIIAREKLVLVAHGEDPDKKEPPAVTVAELHSRFMEQHAPKKKPKTQEMYRSAWSHVLKAMGSMRVKDVDRSHFADLYHKMRHTPTQANRVRAVLHKAMNLAELWGMRPEYSNPVRLAADDRYREKKRRRMPSLNEALRLIRALDDYEKEQPVFVAFIWLLCLTGSRPSEIRTARRDWIEGDVLNLPDSKVGERSISLPEPAREVIAGIPVIRENPYLIPGRLKGHYLVGVGDLWKEVLTRSNIEGLQMRDLRRYFASLGLSQGLTLETVGQLLGHTQAQTTKVYAYLLTHARDAASETTASELIRIRDLARSQDTAHSP